MDTIIIISLARHGTWPPLQGVPARGGTEYWLRSQRQHAISYTEKRQLHRKTKTNVPDFDFIGYAIPYTDWYRIIYEMAPRRGLWYRTTYEIEICYFRDAGLSVKGSSYSKIEIDYYYARRVRWSRALVVRACLWSARCHAVPQPPNNVPSYSMTLCINNMRTRMPRI